MKPKLISFKFTKKQEESKGKTSKSKKNYENIFNDILSGIKKPKNTELDSKDNIRAINCNNQKKNKIKFIEKVEQLSLNEINNKIDDKNIQKDNEICITDTSGKCIDKNIINDYINKSNDELNKINLKLKEKYSTENNPIEKELIPYIKEKESKSSIKDKQQNYIKSVKAMDNKNHQTQKNKLQLKRTVLNKPKKIEQNNNKGKSHKFKIIRSITSNGKINKTFRPKKKESVNNINEQKNKKNKLYEKKQPLTKTNNLINNNNIKKNRQYNIMNKITITNDNIEEKKNYKDYISIKNTIKKKKYILNNTNSNINININITNINDKNTKKDPSYPSRVNSTPLISDLINESNYNSSITTVNIINNNGIPKKISSNKCRLLFHNNANKKNSKYFSKINPQGVKIESININLGEDEPVAKDLKKNKFKFKKNLKKNIIHQNSNIDLDSLNNNSNIYEGNDTQSEYEHFRDMGDFLSSKSLTNYSCKSGFTGSRKLRSLNRERDKIKMMNNLKNNENKIDKIENKLINIVNKFHEDNNSIISTKKKKKKFNFSMKKNIIKNKNYYTLN